MRINPSVTLALILICGYYAAVAQQPIGNGETQPPAPSVSNTPEPKIDESALRYFASQGDTRRLNAEIARLHALYPNWNPPSNLTQLQGSPTSARDPLVDQLWALYKDDKIADMRAMIAERQTTDPRWTPPQDMLDAINAAEARRRLINASDNKQWRMVLTVATETPALLTCMNVDALWRVAEAFAKTEQQNRSYDVYTYVLTNCNDPAERVATLQKALVLLPEQKVNDLLRLERKGGGNPDNFDIIRSEFSRRRVERASGDAKTTANPNDLATVERLAEEETKPDNALLLGWYNFHHNNLEKALSFFKTALDRDGGPKAAEGYASTLRRLNRLEEAEVFAFGWRDKSSDNMKVYLDVATALLSQDPPIRLEAKVLTRAMTAIVAQRFPDGAQALGWYAYNTEQFPTARNWFKKALEWKPSDEPSAYGLALSTQRLNDRAEFNAIVMQWRSRSERIADLADGIAPNVRPMASQAGMPPSQAAISTVMPSEPPASLGSNEIRQANSFYSPSQNSVARRELAQDATSQPIRTAGAGRGNCIMTQRDPSSLVPDAALSLGWCLMEANRPLEAVAAFDHAVRRGSPKTREEAAYGKTLAYLRKDLTSQAAVAAAEAPQTRERRVELNATILAQRAIAAYRDGRYVETLLILNERNRIVPEQTDLMIIKGYSYLKLGRYGDAEKIFRAAQRTGSEEASVGLNSVQEAVRKISP